MADDSEAKPQRLSDKAKNGELDGEVNPVDAQQENQMEMQSGRNLDGLPLKQDHPKGAPTQRPDR